MQGRFRWKTLTAIAVLSALCAGGWFVLHRYQMRSIHLRYLDQATRAEEANPPQYDRAARFLRIYLLAKGDDVDARARYGILLEEKSAPSARSRSDTLAVYERVLADDPKRNDIRMRAAKLCMTMSLVDAAIGHLQFLEKSGATDAAIDIMLGDCKWAKVSAETRKRVALNPVLVAKLDEAELHYREGIRKAPDKVEAYARLANLLRGVRKSPIEATQVLEDLVRANPKLVRARLVRAQFRQAGEGVRDDLPAQVGMVLGLLASPAQGRYLAATAVLAPKVNVDLPGAEQDLLTARELAPENAEVLLVSAFQELAVGRHKSYGDPKIHFKNARSYLERGEKLFPDDARFLSRLADVETADGNPNTAISLLRQAQKKVRGELRNGLLWTLALLLIDTNHVDETREVFGELRKGQLQAYLLDFLEARLAIKEGSWHEATARLESARPLLAATDPALAMQADMMLSQCFEQMGYADQQLTVYQRARRLDPLNPVPRYGLARTLASLGRIDEAIDECENLRSLPNVSIASEFLYARLLIVKNLKQPEASRDMKLVDQILLGIVKADSSMAREVEFVRAEMARAQGNDKEAKEIFSKAKLKWPDQVQPWIALAALEESAPEGLKILQGAEAKFGDLPELRLAKLQPRYAPAKKEAAIAYLQPLSVNVDKTEHAKQVPLLASLAEAYERAEALPDAERFWQKLVRLEPKQIRVYLMLFDYYLRTENRDGMEKTLASINNLDKAGALTHYGKAQILMTRATSRIKKLAKADLQLTEEEKEWIEGAKQNLLAAQAKRPNWSRVSVGLASIAELEGNRDVAIKHLKDAVELGNRQLGVIKSLVGKLMENREYPKAYEVLGKLEEFGEITDVDLQMRAAEISIFNQNADRALQLTERAVSRDSKNYEEVLWQGQMFGALKRPAEADKALRRAIELKGDEASAWVALIQMQTQLGELKKAAGTLEEMKVKVRPDELPLALAGCYQIMEQSGKAQKAFVEALSVQPNNLLVLKSVATFYLTNGQAVEAEPLLSRMLEPKLNAAAETQIWARRSLAMALGFQKDPDKQTRALKLIEENLSLNPASIDDRMVKGVLLANKQETRGEAITILEKAFEVRQPTADQLFLLANLHEVNKKTGWPKARSYMLKLLSAHSKDAKYRRYIAAFVDKALIHGEIDLAEEWLPILQKSIKSQLDGKEKGSELLAKELAQDAFLLTELMRRHPRLTQSIRDSGSVLKESAAKSGKKESLLALADFMASCQQLDECLNLCEEALKELPPVQVVSVAVTAIATNTAKTQQIQRVESWVNLARKQKPEILALDGHLAVLMEHQERYADAEAIYRDILKREPENVMALNNLGFLLGLQRKSADATVMIQKLIAKVGPVGELLDSRSVIYLGGGKLQEAENDIRAALKQQRTPYRLFHLAQILRAEGKTKECREEFNRARQTGLRLGLVHPLERDGYQAIEKLSKED